MTSSVAILPGASPEKLPFVHSKFKPRSKFAKCFNGCKKYSRSKHLLGLEGGHVDGLKLPRITYNARDRRTALGFGSLKRGTRREYQGFTGYPKLKMSRSRTTCLTHSTPAAASTSPGEDSVTWLKYTERDGITGSNNGNSDVTSLSEGAGEPSKRRHMSDADMSLPNLNSLIIVDDDLSLDNGDVNDVFKKDSGVIEITLNSTGVADNDDAIFEKDPFAKCVGDKLESSRGKSGVKRVYKRKEQLIRPLGDVITNKRLQEILTPRSPRFPLKFA